MYSDFLLVDNDNSEAKRVERLAFGDTAGRNESWLRDTLIAHPGLLPVAEIDPAFGPLVPLCTELRTEAGPVDAAFISPHGRLTLVECKLWRNHEARRKVVAQVLDYARVLAKWSYADLQRQVSARTGKHGNVPWDLARAVQPDILENRFVDQATTALREGRFLLLIAGDGIREDVSAIAELINRNSAMGFSFGLIEVALYGMPDGALLLQPRVVARTKIIERSVVVVRDERQARIQAEEDVAVPDQGGAPASAAAPANDLGEGERQAGYRRWWQPVLDAPLDDPDQEPPKLYWPNNVRASLPMKGTWILCFATEAGRGQVGVCTAGRTGYYDEFLNAVLPLKDEVVAELPQGTQVRPFSNGQSMTFICQRDGREFSSEADLKTWIADTLNAFVNAFRPRLRRLTQG